MSPRASKRPLKSSAAGSPRKVMTASAPSKPSWKPAMRRSSRATRWQPTLASNALFASFSRRTTGSSGACAMRRRMDTIVSTQGRRDSAGRLSSAASRLSRSSSLSTTGMAALLAALGAEGVRSAASGDWSTSSSAVKDRGSKLVMDRGAPSAADISRSTATARSASCSREHFASMRNSSDSAP